MSDEKTSQLSEADLPLNGNEIVGIVQDGRNVQTTTSAIANIPFAGESIAIGALSYAASFPFNIAIGYYAHAPYGLGVAIGQYATLLGIGATAIGYNARANTSSAAIGNDSEAEIACVAIGGFAVARNAYSVAIGVDAFASNGAIAVGYRAFTNGAGSVVLGPYSYANNANGAVAIGYKATATYDKALAAGYHAIAGLRGVSVGYHAGFFGSAQASVAIGAASQNTGPYSVAVGSYANTSGESAVAIGAYAYAKTNGTALGHSAYANPGAVAIGDSAHAAGAYSVALGPGAISNNSASIVLGFGAQDQMIGEFVVNGFPAFGSPLFAFDRYQKMVATTNDTDTTSAIMTSDGNSATGNNVPTINIGGITTLTARVTGANSNWRTGGDMATFVLDTPLLMMRNGSGVISFVNSPDFVIENSTVGASSWTVPTFALSGDSRAIFLTVTNPVGVTYWMAHLKCEGSG